MTEPPPDEPAAPVLAERSGHTLTLTLHRPERLNAVTEGMYHALIAQLRGADADPGVRVVVLRGAGRAFCAGADLTAHAGTERTVDQRRDYAALGAEAVRTAATVGVPVVAAVHGYAIGAGAELASGVDFLVAAEDAVLAFPELGLGTYPGGGVTVRLPQLVGLGRARELLFTGRRFTGAEAAQWGLAYRAVPADQLDAAVGTLAGALAATAPVPTAQLKRDLYAGRGVAEALAAEVEALVRCMGTADWREGLAAFAEKRPPRFEGR